MAVFKNGIFAYDNGKPVTPQSLGISLAGIQTCHQFFSSGSLTDTTQRYAVYALVADLENYGLWDKMKVIYPMVGQAGVSSSFQLNLKDPSTFKGTFNGSWNFASTGVTPSSAYMDTGLIPNDTLNQNSTHLSIYINNNTTGDFAEMGAIQSGTQIGLLPNYSGLGDISRIYTSGYPGNIAQNETDGYFIGSRILSSEYKVYRNAVNYRTTLSTSVSPPTNSIYVGAWNDNGNAGLNSTRRYAFATIGDGLTDTEAANLYIAVQRFQTTLGRQV
jgi:hypothetical protein